MRLELPKDQVIVSMVGQMFVFVALHQFQMVVRGTVQDNVTVYRAIHKQYSGREPT